MCGICKGIYVDCSLMQCQAIDNTLRELPVNVHVVVHRSQGGANPSGRNAEFELTKMYGCQYLILVMLYMGVILF